jgi:hypothetical protein
VRRLTSLLIFILLGWSEKIQTRIKALLVNIIVMPFSILNFVHSILVSSTLSFPVKVIRFAHLFELQLLFWILQQYLYLELPGEYVLSQFQLFSLLMQFCLLQFHLQHLMKYCDLYA